MVRKYTNSKWHAQFTLTRRPKQIPVDVSLKRTSLRAIFILIIVLLQERGVYRIPSELPAPVQLKANMISFLASIDVC
jgi:hypothetical protein